MLINTDVLGKTLFIESIIFHYKLLGTLFEFFINLSNSKVYFKELCFNILWLQKYQINTYNSLSLSYGIAPVNILEIEIQYYYE